MLSPQNKSRHTPGSMGMTHKQSERWTQNEKTLGAVVMEGVQSDVSRRTSGVTVGSRNAQPLAPMFSWLLGQFAGVACGSGTAHNQSGAQYTSHQLYHIRHVTPLCTLDAASNGVAAHALQVKMTCD